MADRAGNPSIGGATGPGAHTSEMPDWYGIYYQPEAQKRQAVEAAQSTNRRRNATRDFALSGFHGEGEPELRYRRGPHYIEADKLRQHHARVRAGAVDYGMLHGGKRR